MLNTSNNNEYSPLPGSRLYGILEENKGLTFAVSQVQTVLDDLQAKHAAAAATLASLQWDSDLNTGRAAAAELPILDILLNRARAELDNRQDKLRLHTLQKLTPAVDMLNHATKEFNRCSQDWRRTQALLSIGDYVHPHQVEGDERKFKEAESLLQRTKADLLGQ